MACKRALIMGVIGATRSAGVFSQDLEHIPETAFGDPELHGTWERVPREDVAPAPALQKSKAPGAERRPTQDQVDQARPGPIDTAVRAASEQLDAERAASKPAPVSPPAKPPSAPAPAAAAPPPATAPIPAVSPPAVRTASQASGPPPVDAPPAAGALTVEGVLEEIAAATAGKNSDGKLVSPALVRAKKLLDELATNKIGTPLTRTAATQAWIMKRRELGL